MVDRENAKAPSREYALGHSTSELERLSIQARLVDPITRRFLGDAGVCSGMRVLDVGSGAGDTAFLAAELVGQSGEVVGVDASADAIATARARANERQLSNVSFRECDLALASFDRQFDVLVGRYVLMFQSDPAAMLARLAAHVRPGGVVVFHEPDWNGARSMPPAPSYDLACRWVAGALQAAGHDIHMGSHLHSTFLAAGLPEPALRLESAIGAGSSASDCLRLVGDLVASLMPTIEICGIATIAEIDPDTLATRMCAEVTAAGSVVIGRSEIGAWVRL
jgi:2-polyprenyl-3-methyl-5-hydroxy-6-metoxy-1,4-benzoquinol methylase